MPLVDTHCHLQSNRFDDDREEVIARCLEQLDWLVVIGDDIPSSEGAVALIRDRVYATVGMHPYYAKDLDDACMETLRSMAATPGVIGLGEIGLDYFNELSPRDVQAVAFRRQLELACELELPVVIHNRESDADAYAILSEYADKLVGCVMHCFGSDADYAKRFVDLGFYISFAGNATFSKAQNLRDSAAVVPMDRLLVETDAPYLAPVPLRGKRCEPWHVMHTAAAIAEVKGVSAEALGEATTANAQRFYRIG